MPTPNEVITARIREAREAAGLSQAELGKQLAPYLGRRWTRQEVSALEQGQRRRIYAEELVAFADVLCRPVVWFYRPPDESAPYIVGGKVVDLRGILGPEAEAQSIQRETVREVGRLLTELARPRTWTELWEERHELLLSALLRPRASDQEQPTARKDEEV